MIWASASRAYAEGRSRFNAMVKDRPIIEVVSGKRLIGSVSDKCKAIYDTSFGPMTLCKSMLASEYDPQLKEIIKAITTR